MYMWWTQESNVRLHKLNAGLCYEFGWRILQVAVSVVCIETAFVLMRL